MSAQEIIRIANELAAKGISPSSAMIKARLSQPVPMAELLKVLSQWKQQPQANSTEVPAEPTATAAPASDVSLQQLSARLDRVEQKIDHLIDLLLKQQAGR